MKRGGRAAPAKTAVEVLPSVRSRRVNTGKDKVLANHLLTSTLDTGTTTRYFSLPYTCREGSTAGVCTGPLRPLLFTKIKGGSSLLN